MNSNGMVPGGIKKLYWVLNFTNILPASLSFMVLKFEELEK